MSTNLAVSETSSPPVSLRALPTDSLRTYVVIFYLQSMIMHRHNIHVTYLCCQVDTHFWKWRKVHMLILQSGKNGQSRRSGVCSSTFLVQIHQVLPHNLLPILLNHAKSNHSQNQCKYYFWLAQQFRVVFIKWGGSDKKILLIASGLLRLRQSLLTGLNVHAHHSAFPSCACSFVTNMCIYYMSEWETSISTVSINLVSCLWTKECLHDIF